MTCEATVPLFDSAWRVRCSVRHATKAEAAPMVAAHYLRKFPAVTPCRLVMFDGVKAVGTCIFAFPPRETAVRYGGPTWELARLWIDDLVPKNGESWLIGAAVKHVRREHIEVSVLVSYADPSAGHSGGIYMASNWERDGSTDDGRKTPRFDYEVDGKHYSRRAHVPVGSDVVRVPRVSKPRFIYRLRRE